jgi:hypothetical protein
MMHEAYKKNGAIINSRCINNLLFADDIDLIAENLD